MININNSEICIDGYNIEIKDRKIKLGDGIVIHIYINAKNYFYERRRDLETDEIESIWLQLTSLCSICILICIVYRLPSYQACWIDNYEHHVSSALDEKFELIVMGDFNIDLQIEIKTKNDFIFSNLTQIIN